jgi:hypothetical protein
MVAVFVAVWAIPVTVNVPVVAPAVITTVGGLRVTTPVGDAATVMLAFPVGAGPFNVMVPVAVPAPTTLGRDSVTE